jgi:pyruvate dehydrogenase E1 component alpha subunit
VRITDKDGGLVRDLPLANVESLAVLGGVQISTQALAVFADQEVPVATQLQYAAGIAMGVKSSGHSDAVVAFVGDGGTSEGDFHEAMNVAGVFRLPLVTIVQNNHWAISLPRDRQTASPTLAQKALAYGFAGWQVDGNDALAMLVATREALHRARDGGGPTLIEAVTYRLGEHSTSDNSRKYRTREEIATWEARDPLTRMTRYAQDRGAIDETTVRQMQLDITAEISTAIEEAESYVPDPAEPFAHCFADMPPDLAAQRADFLEYLEAAEGAPPVTRRTYLIQPSRRELTPREPRSFVT